LSGERWSARLLRGSSCWRDRHAFAGGARCLPGPGNPVWREQRRWWVDCNWTAATGTDNVAGWRFLNRPALIVDNSRRKPVRTTDCDAVSVCLSQRPRAMREEGSPLQQEQQGEHARKEGHSSTHRNLPFTGESSLGQSLLWCVERPRSGSRSPLATSHMLRTAASCMCFGQSVSHIPPIISKRVGV
jgi:hypothetical protein